MTEHLKQKLNDSAVLRWSVLALVAFTMLCGYFLTDVMSPLKPMLEKELLWDSLDYGFFTSAYGWFNVFLLMLIFGGIILDKMGVRFTGMGACLLMVFGCGLKYYAISTTFPEGAMLFGFKTQVTLAALGYAIFGVGVEIAGITVSKIIVKWFKGKEMALAMGLEMATARIGTTLAMVLTVPLADFFGSTDESGTFHTNIPAPILFCLIMLCVGTIAFFLYTFYDKKLDASLDAEGLEPEEPFRMKDIVYIITNKGFWLIALGYAIFGVGVEIAGITVSKIIVKWFKGKEMALAMGLEMATARIGTTLAMVLTVPLADFFGSTDESGTFHTNIPAPILFCLIMLCVGTIAFFLYTFYDKKLDASLDAEGLEPEEPFRMKDIVYIITNKGFWLIALLCVLFYSAVFPFIKYAADLMVQKYNVDPKLAGTIPGLLPIGAIILTPLFGSLYDRIGKGATLMIIGSVMLIFVHTMFALPILNIWWFATIIMIILGFAFSLVPSAMWPSVPKIIPEKQLGTAYALIFWVQNWGLMGVPLLIGWVLNTYCKGPVVDGAQTYDYTLPMTIFALFGVLALIVALMLKAENKKKGYGLEEANIQK